MPGASVQSHAEYSIKRETGKLYVKNREIDHKFSEIEESKQHCANRDFIYKFRNNISEAIYDYRINQKSVGIENANNLIEDVDSAYWNEFTGIVSHAGGMIATKKYTNSAESIDQSIKQGLSYIELDVRVTNDGIPVLTHAWEETGGYR